MGRLLWLLLALPPISSATALDVRGYPSEEDFRATCERAAKSVKPDPALNLRTQENIRGATVSACIGMERRAWESTSRKAPSLPPVAYERCLKTSNSYVDANKCLDGLLTSLPRTEINGVWLLQDALKENRYWTIRDCQEAKRTLGRGVCVSK